MKITTKKVAIILILTVFLIDTIIIYSLFKSRSFSHLAIWDIIESDKREEFDRPPVGKNSSEGEVTLYLQS